MAAIEMIHTASLIHDDLPDLDNDCYRRGRKTTWSVYGRTMGILSGDAMLNYAYETAFEAFSRTEDGQRVGRSASGSGRKIRPSRHAGRTECRCAESGKNDRERAAGLYLQEEDGGTY